MVVSLLWSALSLMAGADFPYTGIISAQLLFSRLGYSSSNSNRITKCHPCPLSERWTERVNRKQISGLGEGLCLTTKRKKGEILEYWEFSVS